MAGGAGNPTELERHAHALDEGELALLAQIYLAAGSLREALELSRPGALRRSRALVLCEARARFGLGEHQRAFELVDGLLAEQPADGLASFYKAQLLAMSSQGQAASRSLVDLIAATPDFPGALPLLAQLALPGPPYREVLRHLHDLLRPATYLEIGVESGATLQLARHSQRVIGVDPVPRRIAHELPAGTRLFHQTSDDFFRDHADPTQLLGAAAVDLAFIDGMHWFDFALRDFHGVERWCKPRSLVVLHDCLAVAPVAASRQRRTSFWVGDTWQALDWLIQHRPDLEIAVVPCYPSGLVLITQLEPTREPRPLPSGDEPPFRRSAPGMHEWARHYPLIENTLASLERWLGARRGGDAAPSGCP